MTTTAKTSAEPDPPATTGHMSNASAPGPDSASHQIGNDARVVVVEVGPRDGLQNEPAPVPTEVKVAFINALSAAGLPVIEATSFVNPRAVPQLADASEVMTSIDRVPGILYPVLIPNQKGLERALDAGVDAIALFTAATEAFSQANVGTSIAGTLERFAPVASVARDRGLWMRGYISVAFGCPYSGAVDERDIVRVSEALLRLGCTEICLADTIGSATPQLVRDILSAMRSVVPFKQLSLHFHDTAGMALSNVEGGLEQGVRIFDSAAGGLGGCPFAPGAPGNLSTERLLQRLAELGMQTNVTAPGVTAAVDLLRPYVPRLHTSQP